MRLCTLFKNPTMRKDDIRHHEIDEEFPIKLADLEKHMYMAVDPIPTSLFDSSKQFSSLANYILPFVFSKCSLARDFFEALAMGNHKLLESLSLPGPGEKKEVILTLYAVLDKW
ncbi:hypothetical protein GIB67_012027 [Kingdonia uniflora]|uniref:Uncharacterized protein n=1 Tax=Kingdonia uniflora TaxID=39325 RepID=A0A7J7M089_9MAGN|nr:hypothetical protein GIB67_012027 [Kingdonia uniflora]